MKTQENHQEGIGKQGKSQRWSFPDLLLKLLQAIPLLASLFQIDFWMLAKGGVGEGTEAQ